MRINSADISAAGRGRLLSGPLLVIGGAEDRAGNAGLLRTFVELSGGSRARIVLVTAASGTPSVSFTEYSAAFHRLGVPDIRELRQEQSKGEQTLTELAQATGVFLTGGDQSRLGVLVKSETNRILRDRIADNTLVIAGTSAGATALGSTMILGGDSRDRLHTGPGLGLLPKVIVDMHFGERRRLPRLVAAVRRQPSHLGIGIDEDTAILLRPPRFDVLGRGTVMTVDARPAMASAAPRWPADQPWSGLRLHQFHAGDAFDMDRRRSITKPLHNE